MCCYTRHKNWHLQFFFILLLLVFIIFILLFVLYFIFFFLFLASIILSFVKLTMKYILKLSRLYTLHGCLSVSQLSLSLLEQISSLHPFMAFLVGTQRNQRLYWYLQKPTITWKKCIKIKIFLLCQKFCFLQKEHFLR